MSVVIVVTKTVNDLRNAVSVMVICELASRIDMEFEALGVFAVFVTVLWGMGMKMLYSHIEHTATQIHTATPIFTLSDDIKQQMYDLLTMAIEDQVGNMQPPSAFDHLAGFASAFMQRKLMAQMPQNIFEGVTELDGHGQTIQEENNP